MHTESTKLQNMERQPCGRGVRIGGGRGQNRARRGQPHRHVPDEIRATLVDHVINHGLTMAEAGRRVQPNVGRTTVSSIIQTFRQENRRAYCNVVIQHKLICSALS